MLLVLILLPGCKSSHKKHLPTASKKVAAVTENARVEIPLADGDIRTFFNEDAQDLALADSDDDLVFFEQGEQNDQMVLRDDAVTEEVANCENILFDYNSSAIRPDQNKVVERDIELVKQELAVIESDEKPQVVIKGNACHSAGSAVYNLALSEKRAKEVAKRFEAEGISVKVVGLGSEVPAIINGERVTGNREQQAPNRRVEIELVRA